MRIDSVNLAEIKNKIKISTAQFGEIEGRKATIYHLENRNGMKISVTDFGATLTHLFFPDRIGLIEDLVLGFDDVEGYANPQPNLGATIGRYGNRIGGSLFIINDIKYTLAKNNGNHSLHGGIKGFSSYFWEAKVIEKETSRGVQFFRISPHMEEGYPGNLEVTVTYLLDNFNQLHIEYEANTDEATVVNLTNHSYFNLAGLGKKNILDHVLTISANHFTEVDVELIPTGKLIAVSGTPLDFNSPHTIGERIQADYAFLKENKGYDHNFVLDHKGNIEVPIATVLDPLSGRKMEVSTTEPGVQLYCGNFLNKLKGKNGNVYNQYDGLCLETQHYPDSPNRPSFPTTLLQPEEKYKSKTIYAFSNNF